MQGWSPDFIPKLTEDVVNAEHIDEIIPVDGNDALRLSRALAQQEGIFWRAPSQSRKKRSPARTFSACCPIPASAT
jgi:cysteine synthase